MVLNKGTPVYSQAEGQDSLRQTILYDYNHKSNKKQVKEMVPTWSQNWLPPCNNQSILKEISPGISLEGMMRKLKLQSFGHLMRRVDSLETNSDAGRDWAQEEKGTTEDEMAGWHHGLEGRESE